VTHGTGCTPPACPGHTRGVAARRRQEQANNCWRAGCALDAAAATTWRCHECCSAREEGRQAIKDAAAWVRAEWEESLERADGESFRSSVGGALVEAWKEKQAANERPSHATRPWTEAAARPPRDTALREEERQGLRTPPDTQYHLTLGADVRRKLIIEPRSVDPELDVIGTGHYSLQRQSIPAPRAPGEGQAAAGRGEQECVAVYDPRGACVGLLRWIRALILAVWAAEVAATRWDLPRRQQAPA
jgi:hypothetical protein